LYIEGTSSSDPVVFSLRTALTRFQESKENLDTIAVSSSAETPLLIPLTHSLYVEGVWAEEKKDHVLIDIGTGYYVTKSVIEAKDFFHRKMVYVKQTMDQLQKTLAEKRTQLGYVVEVLQMKLQQQLQPSSMG
jgi:prefoldin alpha subunit